MIAILVITGLLVTVRPNEEQIYTEPLKEVEKEIIATSTQESANDDGIICTSDCPLIVVPGF